MESREKDQEGVEVIQEGDNDRLDQNGNDRYDEKLYDPGYSLRVELIELKIDGMWNVRDVRINGDSEV